jgi:hypothetical protein
MSGLLSKTEVAALRRYVCIAPVSGHRQAVSACPKAADSVEKAFGWRPKILGAADAFYRGDVKDLSLHPKSITDLRGGVEKRRSRREIQSSTFARF